MKIKIPNSLFSISDRTSFRLAVTFLSLVNPNTKQSKDGEYYVMTVKQDTLARLSGLSVATVKRTLAKLSQNGFISFSTRTHRADGKLGTTLYYVKRNALESRYFCVQRKALSQISSNKAFYVYCLCCKLACTERGSLNSSFFHSYSDIADMIISEGVSATRSDIISIIKELITLKLIRRKRTRCSFGDYTDNKYSVTEFVQGRITKKGIKKERVWCKHTRPKYNFDNRQEILYNLEDIVTQIFKSVKPSKKKSYYFFGNKGSP